MMEHLYHHVLAIVADASQSLADVKFPTTAANAGQNRRSPSPVKATDVPI